MVLLGARPQAGLLELGEVADLRALPHRGAGPQMGEWADVAPSSTSDDSSTLAQTRQPAPIRLSITWLPAPMTLPSPTAVAPRRMTLGSSTTSRAS